jgi:type IV pilus assembly protein PilO
VIEVKTKGIPWDKLKKLKNVHKLAILLGAVVLIGLIFYFVLYSPVQSDIEKVEKSIAKLQKELKEFRKRTTDPTQLKAEVEALRAEFRAYKRFLPDKKEVPGLLDQISENGADSGVRVLLIKPGPEKLHDIYAEIPFRLDLQGAYLDLATFFYRVSQMPRIVTINDVNLGSPQLRNERVTLTATCQAKTYRLMTPEEIERERKRREAAQKKRPRRR